MPRSDAFKIIYGWEFDSKVTQNIYFWWLYTWYFFSFVKAIYLESNAWYRTFIRFICIIHNSFYCKDLKGGLIYRNKLKEGKKI